MRVSDEFCSILTHNYLLLKYYLSNIETIKNQDVSSFLKASQIKTDIMFSKQVEYWDFFYVKFVFVLELLARIVIRLVTILCLYWSSWPGKLSDWWVFCVYIGALGKDSYQIGDYFVFHNIEWLLFCSIISNNISTTF